MSQFNDLSLPGEISIQNLNEISSNMLFLYITNLFYFRKEDRETQRWRHKQNEHECKNE